LSVIHPQFLYALWHPMAMMAIPGVIYTLVVQVFSQREHTEMDLPSLKNPLGLSIAIKFGLIYGVISVLVKLFTQTDLTKGLLALSFVSGLTDMDAIALSITHNLKDQSIGIRIATHAVILAAMGNTLLKAGLAVSLGSSALRKQVCIALGATFLAGALAYWIA